MYLVFKIDEISQITHQDFIAIQATLHGLENKRYNCEVCLKGYRGRTNEAEMLQKEREAKACQVIRPTPFMKIGNIAYSTCVGNFYSASVVHLLTAFGHYENGIMPYPGSLMEQPSKVIEVFSVMNQIKQDKLKEREQIKSLSLKAKNGRRR